MFLHQDSTAYKDIIFFLTENQVTCELASYLWKISGLRFGKRCSRTYNISVNYLISLEMK
jgi:hypothetical protein